MRLRLATGTHSPLVNITIVLVGCSFAYVQAKRTISGLLATNLATAKMEEINADRREDLRPRSQPLLDQARKARFSSIPHLSEQGKPKHVVTAVTCQDVANIWFCISQYMADTLRKGKVSESMPSVAFYMLAKGVTVHGLGVFGIAQTAKQTVSPVFNLSSVFLSKHNLLLTERAISGTSVYYI